MHPTLISTSDYNRIPTFEEQTHVVPLAALHAIGEVFVKHSAHDHFCAALLHRHLPLRDGEAMVHEKAICSARRLQDNDRSTLVPHSYFFHPSLGLLPFEFTMNGTFQHPTEPFLHDLEDTLRLAKLDNVICVAPLPEVGAEDIMVETQLADAGGSHSSLESYSSIAAHLGNAVTTNWAFGRAQSGKIQVRSVKACVKNHVGVHEVKD